MIDKQNEINKLWVDLASNVKASKLHKLRNGERVNVGFINQFNLHDTIPNTWFDWRNRVDSKIIVIGQDWGPYSALLPYITEYEKQKDIKGFNYNQYLFDTFTSRTEKFIVKAITNTYLQKYKSHITQNIWNEFFFTVAIMFTRQGKHFRGNEFFDEKLGINESLPYLERQITIVKPRIIMPLGGIAWRMINSIYKLNKEVSISGIVKQQKGVPIIVNNTIIIPNFHPASHIDPKFQLHIWESIWKYFS